MAPEWRRESWQPALIGNRWKEEVGVRRNDAEQRFNRVGKTWSDSSKLNSDQPMDQTGPPGGIEPVNTSWGNLRNRSLRNQTQSEEPEPEEPNTT